MPINCARGTTGGKGNEGMFYERTPKVCAAGVPSAQQDQKIGECLQGYLLQDEVDALMNDAIHPTPPPRPLPPLRHPLKQDMRYAGPYSEATLLINPPGKSKFQTLVEDFKNTVYTSYWKRSVGQVPDPIPTLPPGLDIYKTTLGKINPPSERLYDVVMPKNPAPDITPQAKLPGHQTDRNYCKPAYQPDKIFGVRYNVDPRGIQMKMCLTNDKIALGTTITPINFRQADYLSERRDALGVPFAPNNNIDCVPRGHSFGKLKPPDNLPECLTTCDLNPGRDKFKKCIAHLNSLRICLKKRFDAPFFRTLYLNIKYFDLNKTGWLPKKIIYDFCSAKNIRFDPVLIEPLLATWNAFDGTQIEYKTFINMIDHTDMIPNLPKVWDVPEECIDFRTTYSEMVKPCQQPDTRLMAGLPSGRYFDMDYPVTPWGCCKADKFYLPHESDAKVCLCPSLLSLMGVTHRDMYAVRSPDVVRKMFTAAGEQFTDEEFNAVWNEAKNYHSQGSVSYQTFRKALDKIKNSNDKKA